MTLYRRLLTAGLVAFFLLHAPLCALACLPPAAAGGDTSGELAAMPCHGPEAGSASPASERAASSNPSDPGPGATSTTDTDSHSNTCGCDESLQAVSRAAQSSLLEATQCVAIAASPHVLARLARDVEVAPRPPDETDLPPPDILLLASTLLI